MNKLTSGISSIKLAVERHQTPFNVCRYLEFITRTNVLGTSNILQNNVITIQWNVKWPLIDWWHGHDCRSNFHWIDDSHWSRKGTATITSSYCTHFPLGTSQIHQSPITKTLTKVFPMNIHGCGTWINDHLISSHYNTSIVYQQQTPPSILVCGM